MSDSIVVLPRVGPDDARVAGFSTGEHERVVRVLLPGIGAEDRAHTWSELATAAGVELAGSLRWSELLRHVPSPLRDELYEASGRCEPTLVAVLVGVLTAATSTPRLCTYALWPGFAGELDGVSVTRPADGAAPAVRRSGGLVLHHDGLDWLHERSLGALAHYPVYLWPQDHAFLVACPIYHDSLYVSGPASLAASLARAGLDVVDVTRELPLPSEGD